MKNVILISLPKIETGFPSGAGAVLSSVIKNQNRDVKIFDYNLTLFSQLNERDWQDLESWCMFAMSELPDRLLDKIKSIFIENLSELIDGETELVGFSVFSYFSNRIAELTLSWFKDMSTIPTVAGGVGVSTNTNPKNKMLFGEYIKSNGLASYVIFGEGEIALSELLKGNINYPGINQNNPMQIEDLSSLDLPTYEYFNMSDYNTKKILITGSRGCVRKCTFCDIELTWPKFRFRKAKDIVEEIKRHFYDYGITEFEFTDSLINGSVSNFNEFNEQLYNEKEKHPELKAIRYQGQFICRPREYQTERSYELVNLAGCSMIITGIESFSNNVRYHMKKKFSNEDIDYHFEQCARWGIPNILLMIVGYPTETLEDHQDNINAIKKYQKYANMGTIFMVRWGGTMHLYEHTPIMSMVQDLNIDFGIQDREFDSIYGWTKDSNTLQERIRRRLELHELSVKLGYPMPRVHEELQSLKKLAEHCGMAKTKKFFEIKSQ